MESSAIVVGDWLVAGTSIDSLDVGRIVELDGDRAVVAWSNGERTPCDVSPDDVEVYGSEVEATRRYDERRAAIGGVAS